MNLLKGRRPVSTIKPFNQVKVEFILTNKQLFQLHQCSAGSIFPYLRSNLAEEKARFHIKFMLCGLGYKLKTLIPTIHSVSPTNVSEGIAKRLW